MGRELVPHILGSESAHRGAQASATDLGAWPVTALLLLQARDLDEAAEVAGSHPAVRYGAHIEVRPWGPPSVLTPSS